MLLLTLLTIFAVCTRPIESFMPTMDGSNSIEITDISPDCMHVGPITYEMKFHKYEYTNHMSAVINVTRPVGPLGGAIILKEPMSGRKITITNVTNVCESVGMMKMILPFPRHAFEKRCILKQQVYNIDDMAMEHNAPGMIPEGDYEVTLIAYEKHETVLEMDVMVSVQDAEEKKRKKRAMLELDWE